MDFSGKTVLITGATGLIGSTLAETFSQAGAEVVSAVRDVSRARGRAVAYYAAKPLNFDFRADYIIHAACSAHPLAYSTDPAGVMRANLTGTIMVSGQDANDDAVAALKEGKITVTSYGNPYLQGYPAVKAAVDVLEGKSVESFYEVETVVVTKENADTFKNS